MTPERRRELLHELSLAKRKLSLPAMPALEIGIIRVDAAGRIVEDRSEPGHSWTRNGWNSRLALHGQAGAQTGAVWGPGYLNAKDYWYGDVLALTAYCWLRKGEGGGGVLGFAACPGHGFTNVKTDSVSGLLIGSGTTAFSPEQHTLATLIEHGTGSGQLSYGAMSQSARVYDSDTKIWKATHSRTFTNNSGAQITIRECGLVWAGWLYYQYAFYRAHLFTRDVLELPCYVNNDESVTVQYRMMLDYSEID